MTEFSYAKPLYARLREEEIIGRQGNRCALCGYNKSIYALVVMPADSYTPEIQNNKNLSAHATLFPLDVDDDYITVCLNCRMEVEYNLNHPIRS